MFQDYGSCLVAIETKGQNIKPAEQKHSSAIKLQWAEISLHFKRNQSVAAPNIAKP